jgi:hypothetical protein
MLPNRKHEAVAQAFVADVERNGPRAYKAVYPRAGRGAASAGFSKLICTPAFIERVAELEAENIAPLSYDGIIAGLSRICRSAAAVQRPGRVGCGQRGGAFRPDGLG